MSQSYALSSSDFLPLFDEPRRVPLEDHELKRLFEATDWRIIALDERVKPTYQRFSTTSLFKALALPYLIPIHSERALDRVLEEQEFLQILCGFFPSRQVQPQESSNKQPEEDDKKTPTRATFWHFRHKYSTVYPELMLRVLISMTLSGREPNLNLPFVMPVAQSEPPPEGHYARVHLDLYRPEIEIWTTVPKAQNESKFVVAGKSWAELRRELDERVTRTRQRTVSRRGLAGKLGLPAEVRTELRDGRVIRFGIHKPVWMDSRLGADPVPSLGSSSLAPYAACNILVLAENEQKVLLTSRLAGYGQGAYALPGGKQRGKESLEECSRRELLEETGMKILRSRPVSVHRTRVPGKPQVFSVGVWAEEYEGRPQLREPNQNTEWEWHDLNRLPAPLFGPTRIVITHFMDKTFFGLQWSDVEAQIPRQETANQLELPL